MTLALAERARCGAAACVRKKGAERFSASESRHCACVHSPSGAERRRAQQAGVDEQRVEAAEPRDGRVDRGRRGFRLGEVAGEGGGAALSGLGDGGLRFRLVDVGEQHVVAGGAEGAQTGPAYARRAASYQYRAHADQPTCQPPSTTTDWPVT